MSLIEFNGVSFDYLVDDDNGNEVAFPVLDNFSLKIEEGSFVAILGHNGSGKSTVAKLTNGILFPTSGKVIVDGRESVNDDTVFDIRRKVGMVFQNPDNQIVSTIVEDDVAFGVENLGLPPQECRHRVDDALKRVGMYELRRKSPSMLSGGQKQRVAVAGIIAMKPKCIVLDEPTAMLDPSGRKEVMDTILDLNHNEGITIVLITHFMDEAVLADRVVVKSVEVEETTSSGIILSASAQEKPQIAEVVAVGPGGVVDGKEVEMYVKVGDRVITGKYSGTEVKLNKEEYTIVRQSDILAIVE